MIRICSRIVELLKCSAHTHGYFARLSVVEKPMPALVRFHDYSGDCGSMSSLLGWTSTGFCIAAISCRCQGILTEDNGQVVGNKLDGHIIRVLDNDDPRKMYYYSLFLDCAQSVRIVMAIDCVDENRVCAFGGTQGGGLTLACMALMPNLAHMKW